ncbi:4-phosphoerythronate dehydrogenase [Salinibacter altiplanensis]|uniref:4-phosphoerythronate dehydrogenase n=1 Tax=Salinibacter altiplanensis TaxID=1803181 RepID=UPI000C9FD422
MSPLNILADANIPRVEDAFGPFGTVRRMPGREMEPSDVAAADVLLVRSVTPVGPELLEDTDLRFVGSATIGTDHVDRAHLRSRGIPFAHAPGSNADSVADYVVAALLALARRRGVSLEGRTVGIVGCGNIGGRLARRLPALGMEVLKHDPPQARAAEAAGKPHSFVSLNTVLDTADVVTLHVPLKESGPDPTHHLVDEAFLDRLGDGAWLLNTSRGAVVDGGALLEARRQGGLGVAGLDVWENEPSPDPALIEAVDLATPHIAGYAHDGKVRGTEMLYRALCEELGAEARWEGTAAIRPSSTDALRCRAPDPRLPVADWGFQLARQAYDPTVDDASLRDLVALEPGARGAAFRRLRAQYRRRREMQQHTVPATAVPSAHERIVAEGLTMQIG